MNKVFAHAFFIIITLLSHLCYANSLDIVSNPDKYVFEIYTVGPGDYMESWWGHISLGITDKERNITELYSWGTIQPNDIIVNFLTGKLYFSGEILNLTRHNIIYEREGREVKRLTLNLTPEAKQKLYELASESVKPENKYYQYNFFTENCATRVAQYLNIALDNQLKEQASQIPARMTWREHSHRHTFHNLWLDLGINFVLGSKTDVLGTRWDDFFLPEELHNFLKQFSYYDKNKKLQVLVEKEEIIVPGKKSFYPEAVEWYWPYDFLLGFILGMIPFLLSFTTLRNIFVSWYLSFAGLILSIPALTVFWFNFFSEHTCTYDNRNLILLPIIIVLAIPVGIFMRIAPKRAIQASFALCLTMLASSLGALFLKIFISIQDNTTFIAFFIPFWFGLSLATGNMWLKFTQPLKKEFADD